VLPPGRAGLIEPKRYHSFLHQLSAWLTQRLNTIGLQLEVSNPACRVTYVTSHARPCAVKWR
jgi:hypothetical protein